MVLLSDSLNMDLDCDSSGEIEPQEFGKQTWENERLVALNLNSHNLILF